MARKREEAKAERKKKRKNVKAGRLLALLIVAAVLLVIGIGVPLISDLFPEFTDNYYTMRVYPAVRHLVGYLPQLTRVSFTEIASWVLAALIIALAATFLFKIFTASITFRGTLSVLLSLAVLAGIVLNIFNITGGLNYHNVTLDRKLDLCVKPRTTTQLYGYCIYLRGEANSLRDEVTVNSYGVFAVDDVDAYFVKTAYEVERHDGINPLGAHVPPAKKYMEPRVLSVLGISGINMPFFAESNVNHDQPALLMLSSAAHENAHYLGIAREDEANFAAYLACISSDNANIRYSGVMLALWEASSRLFDADRNLYYELTNGYSDGVTADLKDYSAYWQSYGNTFISRFSSTVNDAYLKYNGVESGEFSYGETVDLMLAHYAKQNGSE